MKLNKLIGDKRVAFLLWQDLEIHFGAFGDVPAAGAAAWRRSEGHARWQEDEEDEGEDVPEEEQIHTGRDDSFVKEGVGRHLPRRRSPTQSEQSKLHQTGSSAVDVGILISTEIREVGTIDKLEKIMQHPIGQISEHVRDLHPAVTGSLRREVGGTRGRRQRRRARRNTQGKGDGAFDMWKYGTLQDGAGGRDRVQTCGTSAAGLSPLSSRLRKEQRQRGGSPPLDEGRVRGTPGARRP